MTPDRMLQLLPYRDRLVTDAENARLARERRDDTIREAAAAGWSLRNIAVTIGIPKSTVANIVRDGHAEPGG